jgi:hypothetical protein
MEGIAINKKKFGGNFEKTVCFLWEMQEI